MNDEYDVFLCNFFFFLKKENVKKEEDVEKRWHTSIDFKKIMVKSNQKVGGNLFLQPFVI